MPVAPGRESRWTWKQPKTPAASLQRGQSSELPIVSNPNIFQQPYGLPCWLSYYQYCATNVCHLFTLNYKVEAYIGVAVQDQTQRLIVFDIGASPNSIRAELLSAEVLASLDKWRKIANLAFASNHHLETMGISTLTVTISGYRAGQPFVVSRQLGADVIFGTTFIDDHVEAIHL